MISGFSFDGVSACRFCGAGGWSSKSPAIGSAPDGSSKVEPSSQRMLSDAFMPPPRRGKPSDGDRSGKTSPKDASPQSKSTKIPNVGYSQTQDKSRGTPRGGHH